MYSRSALIGVAACLIVGLATADCPNLFINVENNPNNSQLVIEGLYEDETYEGEKMVIVLDTVPTLTDTSEGFADVSILENQITMTITGTEGSTFSVTLERPDMEDATVLMASVGNKLCDITRLAAGSADWSWHGNNGPAFWETIGYSDCGPENMFQSPFNIQSASATPGDIVDEISHVNANFTVTQNHGVPVFTCTEQGACGMISANGTKYDLLQFHFHSYSEYSVDGAVGILGVHFVHISEDSQLLVLGRIYVTSENDNAGFAKFWTEETVGAKGQDGVTVTLNIDEDMYADGFTSGNSLYTFQGSLTTPPCSGGVQWLFMGSPGKISMAQANIYRGHAAKKNPRGENRPLQPINNRPINVITF